MSSVECLPPSCQLRTIPRPTEKIECGCCHQMREPGHIVHHVLGQLCRWCCHAFDQRIDRIGGHCQSCANCIESATACELHAN